MKRAFLILSLLSVSTPISVASPVDRASTPPTCMAYWTGFELEESTGRCVAMSATGCHNPFRFETEEDCQAGNTF